MELWEISLGPTPLIIAASEQVYAHAHACVQGCQSANHGTFLGSLSQRGHAEGKKQHQKTNDYSSWSVNRTPIVATGGITCIIIPFSRPPVAIACLRRVVRKSWTSVEAACAAGRCSDAQMRLSNDHPTLVVLESALGGLHGDNGAAAIGSAVGCRRHYSCTSRNANACLQRLELHRRATHATLCRLQRWKMGRGGSRPSSCWSVASQFTVTWPCVLRAEPAKLSLLAEALLAKEHSACSATEQGCAMPPLLCKKAVHFPMQRCSLVRDKRHVDVQRLFCTISLGRHIGLAAMDSYDACHDRPSRIERGRAVCNTTQGIVI